MLTPDQMLAAHKANVETLMGLTNKAFEGLEKLVELNVKAAKTAIVDGSDHTHTLLSVKDAQQLLALQAKLMQPLAEKAAAYNRQVVEIAKSTGEQFQHAAQEQAHDAGKQVSSALDSAFKNAPAGTENAAEMMKSAVSAANSAFEHVQKALKQANDLAQANLEAFTHQAGQTKGKK